MEKRGIDLEIKFVFENDDFSMPTYDIYVE